MSLDVYLLKLAKFPEDYKPYSEVGVVHGITEEQAEYLNAIVHGCCVIDDFHYFDIYGYAEQNELECNGWSIDNTGEYIVLRCWDDEAGWFNRYVPINDMPTISTEDYYILHYTKIESCGGNEIFVTEDNPPNEFYSLSDLPKFETYLYDKDQFESMEEDEVIYMNY